MFARHPQPCPQGECFERVTEVRDGACTVQHPSSPDERIIDCSDEMTSHLTTGGKVWIAIGVVPAGMLTVGYFLLAIYAIGHTEAPMTQ